MGRPVVEKLSEFGVDITGKLRRNKVVLLQGDGTRIVVDFTTGALRVIDPTGVGLLVGELRFDSSNRDRLIWKGVIEGVPAEGFVVTDNEPNSVLVQGTIGQQPTWRVRFELTRIDPDTILCTNITGLRTVQALSGQLKKLGLDLRPSPERREITLRLVNWGSAVWNLESGEFVVRDSVGEATHWGVLNIGSFRLFHG